MKSETKGARHLHEESRDYRGQRRVSDYKTRGSRAERRTAPRPRARPASSKAELAALRAEMSRRYGLGTKGLDGWIWTFEYPGFFQFSRPDGGFSVQHTPDFNDDGQVCVQVTDADGGFHDEFSLSAAEESYSRPLTADKLVKIVRPVLAKIDGRGVRRGRRRGR